MMKACILMLFSLVNLVSISQVSINRIEEVNSQEIIGTFQIIISHEDMVQPELTPNLLDYIAMERKPNETIQIELNDYTRILILSKEEIEAEGFKPLKTYRYE